MNSSTLPSYSKNIYKPPNVALVRLQFSCSDNYIRLLHCFQSLTHPRNAVVFFASLYRPPVVLSIQVCRRAIAPFSSIIYYQTLYFFFERCCLHRNIGTPVLASYILNDPTLFFFESSNPVITRHIERFDLVLLCLILNDPTRSFLESSNPVITRYIPHLPHNGCCQALRAESDVCIFPYLVTLSGS